MLTKTFSFIINNSFKVWKGFVAMLALQTQLASGSRVLTKEHKINLTQSCSSNVDFLSTVQELCPATCTNWINSQLSAPERSIASSLSQDKLVEESYPSLSLKKQLESIAIQKVIDDSSAPDGFKAIIASRIEKAKIKQALIAVNNAATLASLIKHDVAIFIVSDAYMKKWTGFDNFSGCYLATPINLILLNQHHFENELVEDRLRYEQLVATLANEVSHALVANHHPKKASALDEEFVYKMVLPCENEEQQEKFIKALDAYLMHTERYKKLVEKAEQPLKFKMTFEEKKQLDEYDASLRDYITPRLGSEAYNAMQVHLTKKGDTIQMYKDKHNMVPPLSEPNERLKYLRKNFISEIETKGVIYEFYHKEKIHLYTGDKNQHYADLLSDFETLPPEARKVFGRQLCEFLTNFFATADHCERPQWPKPKL